MHLQQLCLQIRSILRFWNEGFNICMVFRDITHAVMLVEFPKVGLMDEEELARSQAVGQKRGERILGRAVQRSCGT